MGLTHREYAREKKHFNVSYLAYISISRSFDKFLAIFKKIFLVIKIPRSSFLNNGVNGAKIAL